MKITRSLFIGFAAAMALAGCSMFQSSGPQGGSPEAWAAISNGAPVRVAVFAGPGARGVGMFRWIQLMDQSPELETVYVDGEAIRNGALAKADLLVMPGGMANVEARDLGAEGQRAVRGFIEQGGSYVGTCAGAFLVMEGTVTNKTLGIVPFKHRRGGWGGEAMLQVKYANGRREERFHGGPVMDPAAPVPGADFKAMATFDCNLHSFATTNRYGSTTEQLPQMAGAASAVAGTFGKGRVWIFATHPEYYPSTWRSVKDAFRFLTGRDITITAPQRRRGQLSVGWWCKPGPGPVSAELIRALVRSADFDVTPYSTEEIDRTALCHEDAFVVPDAADAAIAKKMLDPKGSTFKALQAYMRRGGTVVTWGAMADGKLKMESGKCAGKLVVLKDGAELLDALRKLKAAPAPKPRPPAAKKVAKPVRTAVYYDRGASGTASVRWAKLLSLSKECEFTAVDAEDVRNGALKNFDLYVAPGGSSAVQAATLKAMGRTNLVEFVRNGGAYFGTCAGNYLILTQAPDEKPIRLGMLPYMRQKSPYRGGSILDIRFTDNADLFGFKPRTLRSVRYHGGPVLNACEQIPGADIKEIARYACEGVYSYNTNAAPTMLGHPAIVAGTFGKGRLVGCSPHPESYTHTQDIIRGGLKYLTGRDFACEYPQRTRGNLAVGFKGSRMGKDGAMLAAALYREPTLDLRAMSGDDFGCGVLEHCDALVVPHANTESFSRRVVEFLKNGGKVFTWCAEKDRDALISKIKDEQARANVVVCKNTEEVKQALVAYSKEN